MRTISLLGGLALAAACGALISGATAASSVLPQQIGIVDLATQGNMRIDGAEAGGLGGIAAEAGDFDGDGITDVVVGTPGAGSPSRPATGAAYVVFGHPTREVTNVHTDFTRVLSIEGAQFDEAGAGVSAAGDVNGDGLADVLVRAPDAGSNGRPYSGTSYVVFGRKAKTEVALNALGAGGFRIDGAQSLDQAGTAFGAGDVNGDGRSDVVITAHRASNNGRSFSGSAYVVFGKASTTPVDLAALGEGGFRIDGAAAEDFMALARIAGDVNGDGRADVIVGASGTDNNGRRDSGSAYVVFGKTTSSTVDLAALGSGGFRIDGAADLQFVGHDVSGAGDVNGDGRPDLLVGSFWASYNGSGSGAAWVVFGKASTETVDLAALGDDGFRVDGAAALDNAGWVAFGGDVNGDGRADVLVGAPGADNNGRSASGSVYVVYGKSSTETVDLRSPGGRAFRIDGAAPGHNLTVAASGTGGDVNGDGRADVVVGPAPADITNRSGIGSVYVVFGYGEPKLEYEPLSATAGQAVARHAPRELARTGVPTFRASPPLPRGLRFDATGAMTGTPLAAQATKTHSVTMVDLAGQVTAPLVLSVARDRVRPRLTVRALSPQRLLRQRRIVVHAGCNEPCRLSAEGAISVRGGPRIRLRRAAAVQTDSKQRVLVLALSPSARTMLAGYLTRRARLAAVVTVSARDFGGNTRTATRAIVVRR